MEPDHREHHSRTGLRYASDLTDAEWALLEPLLPPPCDQGRPRSWRDAGLFEMINHMLVMADRERVGREASPSAVVLDSQSVRTIESGGPRGYDAGRR